MDLYAKEKSYEEYRLTGVHRFLLDIPDTTEELKMVSEDLCLNCVKPS